MIMKQLTYILLVGTALSSTHLMAEDITIDPTPAPTSSFALDIGVGYNTKYIWRGLDLGNDMVELSAEATGSYAGLDLTAGAWYAHASDQVSGAPKGELDLYVEASKDLGFATASVGYIFYHFANSSSAADDAQEVYFELSKDIAGFSTSFTYFWDIETDNQGYSELAIEREITIPMSVDTGVTVGYLVEEGALSHITGKISKSFDLYKGLTATPYVAYTVELDGNYVTTEQNELFAGVSFGYSF